MAPFSEASYLAAPAAPRRIVLCPPGVSVAGDLAFLERVAARLLWPAPPARMADAIGGIRGEEMPAPPRSRGASAGPRRARGPALLLEGTVDAARARAALRASPTRDWIVESAVRVRLTTLALSLLAREGVRWTTLDPIVVVALYASPELARRRAAWRGLLPQGTPVWARTRFRRRGPG